MESYSYPAHLSSSSASPHYHPPDIFPIVSEYTMDQEVLALFRHLQTQSSAKRLDILKTLRKVIKRSVGCPLPPVGHSRVHYFEILLTVLVDETRPTVLNECLMLIVELVPSMEGHDLDACMAVILPKVIPMLGNDNPDVKRATLKLLHVYMRYTNNLQRVLSLYVQYGVENRDHVAQKGSIISLPMLFTEEFGNENLFLLVDSLGNLLVNSDTSIFYPVFLAMQRLHSISGNEIFKIYLKRINSEAASLYRSVLSRNSTAESSSPTGRDLRDLHDFSDPKLISESHIRRLNKIDSGQNIANYHNDKPVEIEKIITGGDGNTINAALREFRTQESTDENGGGSDSAEGITYIPAQVTSFPTFHPLEFGIFPYNLILRANSMKLPERLDAIDAILAILKDAPIAHINQLIPLLGPFIVDFVAQQLEHSNFKVTLSALEMLDILVERLKVGMMGHIRLLVTLLYRRMGDGRTVVRDNVIRVFHQMMFTLPPQQMLDTLFEQKHSRNPKVREEMVNRVTAAVSTFPRGEFNLPKLCFLVAPMLTDNRRQVRLATLECLAVLAQALGPHKLAPLISAVNAIERTCDCDGLAAAMYARLARRALPRSNPDGTVRYVLNTAQFSGWFTGSNEADADIEWVMQASSSNSGTPPKFPAKTKHKISNGGIPSGIGTGIPHFKRKSIVSQKSPTAPPHPLSSEESEESVLSPEEVRQLQIQQENSKQEARAAFERMQQEIIDPELGVPPERQSYLDHFKGVSFDSEEEGIGATNERRISQASLEVWGQYFNRFKKQLAETVLCHRASQDDSVLSGSPNNRRIDDINNNSYQTHHRRKSEHLVRNHDYDEELKDGNRSQLSSAPSIASGEMLPAYMPPRAHVGPSHEEPMQAALIEEQTRHERSLSLPSLTDLSRPNSELTVIPQDEIVSKLSVLQQSEAPPPPQEVTPSKSKVTFMTQLDENEERGARSEMENHEKEERNASSNMENENEERSSPHNQFGNNVTMEDGNPDQLVNISSHTHGDNSNTSNLPIYPDENGTKPDKDQFYPPSVNIESATPIRQRSLSEASIERRPILEEPSPRLDVATQKDETLSSETSTEIGDDDSPPRDIKLDDPSKLPPRRKLSYVKTQRKQSNAIPAPSNIPVGKKRAQPIVRRRVSRSISPQPARRLSRQPQQLYIKTTPAIPANANIRQILSNVAKTEGPFENPIEAMKASLIALHDDAWTTKVEGMLAITRLATFHANVLLKEQHGIATALVYEVKNLRSTVSRSAIFTIGELFAKLRSQIEPEMDIMCQALLHKAGENVVFIREDIERALMNMVEEMPQTRAALSIILNGSNHRNTFVRKTSAQFLTILVEKMGSTKCLLGPKDIGEHLLPAAARFVQDGSPHTRYFGRKIFAVLMQHSAFDKLLRKHVTPGTFRNICGILESIKRRGIGDRPGDLISPCKSLPQYPPFQSISPFEQ